MEPMKDIKIAKEIRDKISMDYTSKNDRVTTSFIPFLDSKKDLKNVKGFASMDFYVEIDKKDELKKELLELYEEEKQLIASADLHPLLAEHDYEEKAENGKFVKNPNIKVVRFVLELNKGDYERLVFPLSQNEEDAMRDAYDSEQLTKAERKDEVLFGKRHL